MLEEVKRAIPTFVAHQQSDDTTLVAALVASGRSRELAQALTTFVPIAVARVLLAKLNVQCPETFKYAPGAGGKPTLTGRFAAVPVFVAATQLASAGLGQGEVIATGGRSAEFHAVNQLLNSGSRPENIRLTEPIVAWPGLGHGPVESGVTASPKGLLGRLFRR